MKTLVTLVSLLALAAGSAAVADPSHDDDDGDRDRGCHSVHAMIVDSHTTDGCTSTLFCAAGVVFGNLGLHGTTYFTMDGVVKAPPTAGAGMAATTGILVYTTPQGTLTVRETGIGDMKVDASSGIGASFEQVLGGTGRYDGATGVFYLASVAGDGQFVADVSGQLCLP